MLGHYGKDVITGFSGYITAHIKYLTGVDQYYIRPDRLGEQGQQQDGEWLDVGRVEIDGTKPVLALNKTSGLVEQTIGVRKTEGDTVSGTKAEAA